MNKIKTYNEFINEQTSMTNISYKEARQDIDIVRNTTTKQEKALIAKKYNIASNKTQDIVQHIRLFMNDVHKNKSFHEYTDEDFL